jgi:hypothetical protein
LKLLEEIIGKTLEDTGTDIFLNRSPTGQEIRANTDKWDCIKLKSPKSRDNLQSRRKSFPGIHQIKD